MGDGLVAEEGAAGMVPIRSFEKLPQLQSRPASTQGQPIQCLCNNIFRRGKPVVRVPLFWELLCVEEE